MTDKHVGDDTVVCHTCGDEVSREDAHEEVAFLKSQEQRHFCDIGCALSYADEQYAEEKP